MGRISVHRFRMFILIWIVPVTLIPQDRRAPEISFDILSDADLSLAILLEKGPVVIDYWALWCAPCLRSMRHLENLQRKYAKDGLQVVAVNIDSERSAAKVRGYIKSRGYTFAVALDHNQITYRMFNGVTLPYTLLISREGRIVYRHVGYSPGDERELADAVRKVLKR